MTTESDQNSSKMAYLVRPADVHEERGTLAAFLSAHLSPDTNDSRYEWLYCMNPAGMARVWVACDAKTDAMIGISAAFPRRIRHREKEVRGYVLGDFCIHPDYRSLGPALALQRCTLQGLSNEGVGFVLDFPSTSMLAIYNRLRIEPRETSVRFAKPLRADRHVRNLIANKAAARILSAGANVALRLRDIGLSRSNAWTIVEETTQCGEEFTLFSRLLAPRMGVCGDRSAEYLNWRFMQHPKRRYQLVTARKDGRLCGFLIYHRDGEDAAIVDLLAEEDRVVKAILIEAIAVLRRSGAHTVSAPFLKSHPGQEVLKDCGFQPRESTPVMTLSLPWAANHGSGPSADRWYLTHGDRES